MRTSDQNLIQRLQERNADRLRATDGGKHRRKPFLTASDREIEVAEEERGFEFPELLRALYSHVANGGFGPALGILGFKWGACVDGHSLESCHRSMQKLELKNSAWRWPGSLLPLAGYGNDIWSCVDCDSRTSQLVLWDPRNLDASLDGTDAQLNWGGAFWDQGLTLRTWLEGWLAQKPEPKRKRPSDSWMRTRLGLSLRKSDPE